MCRLLAVTDGIQADADKAELEKEREYDVLFVGFRFYVNKDEILVFLLETKFLQSILIKYTKNGLQIYYAVIF